MPIARVNGIKLAYEEQGSGPPLLLIMGLSGPKEAWRYQLPALAAHYRTIIYDNRGCGGSDQPPPPYAMQTLAADAVGLLDHLEIAAAHVFGISMGGMVAQHLALEWPARVRGLVLGCTTCGAEEFVFGEPAALELLLSLSELPREERERRGLPILFSPAFIAAQPGQVQEYAALGQANNQSRDGYRGQLEAILGHDTCARLGQIQSPTLVLHGTEDALVPVDNGRLLAQRIPGARLVEFAGVGHCFFMEQSEPTNRAVLEFLSALDREGWQPRPRSTTMRVPAPARPIAPAPAGPENPPPAAELLKEERMSNLQTISIADFYQHYFPTQFKARPEHAGSYTLEHEVDGVAFAMRVTEQGRLEVLPHAVADPLMRVRMSTAAWRDAVTGQVQLPTAFSVPGQITPARLQKLRAINGRLDLDLSRPEREPWRASVIFNAVESPAVTLRMAAADYAALQRGELSSQRALMAGRLKFNGDLGLLLKLSALM